jgi:hypothetical protein
LKEPSHDATGTGDISRIYTAVTNVLYASNLADGMYLSRPFEEKFSFSPFYFALLREMMTSL